MHDVRSTADLVLAGHVLDIVRDVLGPDLAGAWLHGSWVHGGLREGSDLDVLVVATRRPARGERDALVRGLLALSGRSAGARPVELTLVVAEDVRPWRYPPPLALQYGEWWRRDLEAGGEPWASPSADLAIVLAAALQGSEPLAGPPLVEVLDPVPAADLRRALVDALPVLGADLEGDEANVLLTFARILVTLVTGRIMSKDEAARWALGRLDPAARPALRWARGVYLRNGVEATVDRAQVRACAHGLLAAIAEAADREA